MCIRNVVTSIDQRKPAQEICGKNNTLLGLIFPTHGFTAPWRIFKFVWQLPGKRAADAFCVASRAGLKFGRVFVPGIIGSATFINLLYYYPAIFISYGLFSVLIRIPLLNRLFTYTTLTHISSWRCYREPKIRLKNIAVENMKTDFPSMQNQKAI